MKEEDEEGGYGLDSIAYRKEIDNKEPHKYLLRSCYLCSSSTARTRLRQLSRPPRRALGDYVHNFFFFSVCLVHHLGYAKDSSNTGDYVHNFFFFSVCLVHWLCYADSSCSPALWNTHTHTSPCKITPYLPLSLYF